MSPADDLALTNSQNIPPLGGWEVVIRHFMGAGRFYLPSLTHMAMPRKASLSLWHTLVGKSSLASSHWNHPVRETSHCPVLVLAHRTGPNLACRLWENPALYPEAGGAVGLMITHFRLLKCP